ncbi:hypothetical protein KKA69_02130 [Patescibacteria group bacterium]|nr:hypothetical protein [Patescibacteria group bacterium]
MASFILFFLFHAIYSIWAATQSLKRWVQTENVSGLSLYFEKQEFFLGFSYALAVAFTVYAILNFLQHRRSGAGGLAGGITLTGILFIGACILLGCCGSPMLVIYLSLFGSSFLGFTKPLVATITAVSVVIGYFWLRKKTKSCCEKKEQCSDLKK